MEGESPAGCTYGLRMHSMIHCPSGRWARNMQNMHHLRNARKADAGPASLCIIYCDFQRPKYSLPWLLCLYSEREISCVVGPYYLLPGLLPGLPAVAPTKRTNVKLQWVRACVCVCVCVYIVGRGISYMSKVLNGKAQGTEAGKSCV